MSRIGRKPIHLIEGVTVSVKDEGVEVLGPKGTQVFLLDKDIEVSVTDGKVVVSSKTKDKQANAIYGFTRAMIANMILGVSKGFEKRLELVGVGFRAKTEGNDLVLSIGFSHPVRVKAPEGITFAVLEGKSPGSIVSVSGIDKHMVGEMAAQIRHVKPPEPYKGKGIRYMDERIRKKAGKAAKAVGTTK